MRLQLLFILVISTSGMASTIHVPADQPTIQAGIDAASAGDTVLVACGTYYEHDITIDKVLVLWSEDQGPECVTIDAQQLGRCIFIDGVTGTIKIIGFTLTGGHVEGEYPDDKGGAIFCQNTSLSIMRCIIVDNYAGDDGGGFFFTGQEVTWSFISECTFIRNSALDYGGAILATQSASPTLFGCTLVANSASFGGGVYCNNNTSPMIVQSIIAFGSHGEAVYCDDAAPISLECCDVYGNEGGDWVGCIADQIGVNGNISLDPLFCDFDMDNYHLRNDSPCAPDNNDCGVLMGAWPVGCSTSADNATWGEVKALY